MEKTCAILALVVAIAGAIVVVIALIVLLGIKVLG